MAYLRPYLQDDYLADLRSNSSQQGEVKGKLWRSLMHSNVDFQINQGNINSVVKVQGLTKLLPGSKTEGLGFEFIYKLGFVYIIT